VHTDWVPIGPRFSNVVLQALLVSMSKRPPKVRIRLVTSLFAETVRFVQGHRLLILATTSNAQMLSDMGALEAFSADLRVPPIDRLEALLAVTHEVGLFSPNDRPSQLFKQRMREADLVAPQSFVIGIKKWLLLIEMAAQAGPKGEDLRAEVLFERLYDVIGTASR
jgi:vesicle-fusing ATPase